MTVLIAYASAHGSTRKIAHRIGERLERTGLQTHVCEVDDVTSLDRYEGFVIGSAIQNGAWLAPAADLVRGESTMLSAGSTWLFSVGSLGDTSSFFGPRTGRLMRRMRGPVLKRVAELVELCSARGHRNFAGVIERDRWGGFGNLFLRVAGGSFGDHRDWADIEAWADEIGSALQLDAAERDGGLDRSVDEQ